jgi:hypothetical protein
MNFKNDQILSLIDVKICTFDVISKSTWYDRIPCFVAPHMRHTFKPSLTLTYHCYYYLSCRIQDIKLRVLCNSLDEFKHLYKEH